MDRRFPLDLQEPSKPQRRRLFNVLGPSKRPEIRPPPSMVDTLLGAIDVMQERIAQARLLSEPPEVLLTPRLGELGPFEYHRAAMAITEGREAVARMLPTIHRALLV
jgi:predicted acylesterase/phospholipase RssA